MTEASLKILETNPTCREDRKAWKSALLPITGRLSREKKLQFLLPLVAFERGHLSRTWTFCKYLQKKGLAVTSPVTPAKLYCCIVIIIVLIALNVLLFTFVAVRSRKPDSHVLYVTCPKGWIGFGYKCFYFSEDSMNWTFSQTFCTSLGAVLVQFETEEELNFLKRYKDSSDHWIGLNRESSHHPWKWTDNSTYNASFVITGTGEYAYLNDVRISSSRVYANRKWICSKTNSNVFIPLSTSRPF